MNNYRNVADAADAKLGNSGYQLLLNVSGETLVEEPPVTSHNVADSADEKKSALDAADRKTSGATNKKAKSGDRSTYPNSHTRAIYKLYLQRNLRDNVMPILAPVTTGKMIIKLKKDKVFFFSKEEEEGIYNKVSNRLQQLKLLDAPLESQLSKFARDFYAYVASASTAAQAYGKGSLTDLALVIATFFANITFSRAYWDAVPEKGAQIGESLNSEGLGLGDKIARWSILISSSGFGLLNAFQAIGINHGAFKDAIVENDWFATIQTTVLASCFILLAARDKAAQAMGIADLLTNGLIWGTSTLSALFGDEAHRETLATILTIFSTITAVITRGVGSFSLLTRLYDNIRKFREAKGDPSKKAEQEIPEILEEHWAIFKNDPNFDIYFKQVLTKEITPEQYKGKLISILMGKNINPDKNKKLKQGITALSWIVGLTCGVFAGALFHTRSKTGLDKFITLCNGDPTKFPSIGKEAISSINAFSNFLYYTQAGVDAGDQLKKLLYTDHFKRALSELPPWKIALYFGLLLCVAGSGAGMYNTTINTKLPDGTKPFGKEHGAIMWLGALLLNVVSANNNLFKESPVYTPNLWNTTIASLNKKVRDSAKILKKMLKSNYEDLDKAWANNAGSENNTPPKQKRKKNRRAASEASDARSEDKTPLQEKQKENYGTVSEANEARSENETPTQKKQENNSEAASEANNDKPEEKKDDKQKKEFINSTVESIVAITIGTLSHMQKKLLGLDVGAAERKLVEQLKKLWNLLDNKDQSIKLEKETNYKGILILAERYWGIKNETHIQKLVNDLKRVPSADRIRRDYLHGLMSDKTVVLDFIVEAHIAGRSQPAAAQDQKSEQQLHTNPTQDLEKDLEREKARNMQEAKDAKLPSLSPTLIGATIAAVPSSTTPSHSPGEVNISIRAFEQAPDPKSSSTLKEGTIAVIPPSTTPSHSEIKEGKYQTIVERVEISIQASDPKSSSTLKGGTIAVIPPSTTPSQSPEQVNTSKQASGSVPASTSSHKEQTQKQLNTSKQASGSVPASTTSHPVTSNSAAKEQTQKQANTSIQQASSSVSASTTSHPATYNSAAKEQTQKQLNTSKQASGSVPASTTNLLFSSQAKAFEKFKAKPTETNDKQENKPLPNIHTSPISSKQPAIYNALGTDAEEFLSKINEIPAARRRDDANLNSASLLTHLDNPTAYIPDLAAVKLYAEKKGITLVTWNKQKDKSTVFPAPPNGAAAPKEVHLCVFDNGRFKVLSNSPSNTMPSTTPSGANIRPVYSR